MKINLSKDYNKLITSVGTLLEQARKQAYQQVNYILVKTYWQIGKRIVEYEQSGKKKAEYGSRLLDRLSKDLTDVHGKGFSRDNLERMRKFYLRFSKSATLSRKLGWSHYCLIMRIDDQLARNFYINEAENLSWSVRELGRQINSMLFERLALSRNPEQILKLAEQGQIVEKPRDLIKEPYIFEFLGLEEVHRFSESDLEEKLITNLKGFLLELGKGFMFVARQQRITLEDEHFYIDLVFYNRILRCFVLIELKIGKLTHKALGQLQMYVNYYDRKLKHKQENPTIGILLCADKKKAIVKYTLPEKNNYIFASKYKLYLPDKELLQAKVRKIIQQSSP